jgi:hypothetical protein
MARRVVSRQHPPALRHRIRTADACKESFQSTLACCLNMSVTHENLDSRVMMQWAGTDAPVLETIGLPKAQHLRPRGPFPSSRHVACNECDAPGGGCKVGPYCGLRALSGHEVVAGWCYNDVFLGYQCDACSLTECQDVVSQPVLQLARVPHPLPSVHHGVNAEPFLGLGSTCQSLR